MTVDQAADLTGMLKGLMPKMTLELEDKVGCRLLDVDVGVARSAIDRYAENAADFVLADFLRCLPSRGPIGQTAAQRTTAMLIDERKQESDRDNEERLLDEVLAGIPPDELARHRAAALDEMEASQAELIGKLTVDRSITLRRAIARRISSGADYQSEVQHAL